MIADSPDSGALTTPLNRLDELVQNLGLFESDRLAIIEPEGATCSYGELVGRVRSLSGKLTEEGLQGGGVAALLVPKSCSSIVAVCSILALNAAYVPLDSAAPLKRNLLILQDCRPQLLLIDRALLAAVSSEIPWAVEAIDINESGLLLLHCRWPASGTPVLTGDLAVILYTSGSTGTPKGVQLTHINVMTFVRWCLDALPVTKSDICASLAPLHFDLSLFDVFASLARGACIALFDQKTVQNPRLTARYLETCGVTTCYATPTLLTMLLQHGNLSRLDHSALSLVLFAGEAFPPKTLHELMAIWAGPRFYNLYGPTESNVVTFYEIPGVSDKTRERPYPIGNACAHTKYLLQTGGEITAASPGAEGELLVSGPTVTPGYLGNDASNHLAFTDRGDDGLYYHTGDLVRVAADGNLEFVRRIDRTVKRRGYRIALEEIEQVLALHPDVMQVAAVVRSDQEQTRISVFLVTRPDSSTDKREFQRHCLAHLPSGFLPDEFVLRDQMPSTSTGKLDYLALEAIER